MNKARAGFTIVELLVVIVVIAILATITLIVYNGLQNRAHAAVVASDVSQAARQLEAAKATDGEYPPDANNLGSSHGTTYQYTLSATDGSYCLTGTNGTVSYKVSSSNPSPVAGGCPGHGQGGVAAITNLSTNPRAIAGYGGWSNNAPTSFSVTWETSIPSNPAGITTAVRTQLLPDKSSRYVANVGYVDGMGPPFTTRMNGAWVWASAGGYRAYFYRSQSADIQFFPLPPSTWTFITTKIPNPGIAYVFIDKVNSSEPVDSSDYAYVTGSISIEGDKAPSGFFDGNSPNWIWNGPTNHSTSTGPAQ